MSKIERRASLSEACTEPSREPSPFSDPTLEPAQEAPSTCGIVPVLEALDLTADEVSALPIVACARMEGEEERGKRFTIYMYI